MYHAGPERHHHGAGTLATDSRVHPGHGGVNISLMLAATTLDDHQDLPTQIADEVAAKFKQWSTVM